MEKTRIDKINLDFIQQINVEHKKLVEEIKLLFPFIDNISYQHKKIYISIKNVSEPFSLDEYILEIHSELGNEFLDNRRKFSNFINRFHDFTNISLGFFRYIQKSLNTNYSSRFEDVCYIDLFTLDFK